MLPVSTVFGGHAQSFGFHDQVPASRTGPSVPAATPLHPQPLLPRQPLLQPVSWASNGGEEKSPSIVREIRILRSPEPVRPRKRSDANDDRTRRRRSPSRSTRRRRDKSPSRSRGRWRSAQSRSRSRHRRKKRSSSGSIQVSRSRKSPVKSSVFSSAKEFSASHVESNETGEATAEAIRLAQLKAASSLRANAPPPPVNMRPDDWFCPVCTTHNYASRNRCFRCNQGVNPGRGSSHSALGQR